MCRTVHALLQTVICGIQMLVRVFMTIILMIENVIRMILQTLYNFISFLLQMLSLIPICLVFLLTARLKCFMCGGGGACPVARGGTCDCVMSALAILIVFLVFRATGVLDKLFYHLGYAKTTFVSPPPRVTPLAPYLTPSNITKCSRPHNTKGRSNVDGTTPMTPVNRARDDESYEDVYIINESPATPRSPALPDLVPTPYAAARSNTNNTHNILRVLDFDKTTVLYYLM